VELVAADRHTWVLGGNDPRMKAEQWSSQSVPPLTIYSPVNISTAAAVANVAATDGCPVVRVSVRRTAPNLEVQWRLADIRRQSSRDMIETVRRLAESV
jgi:hypothetical protein